MASRVHHSHRARAGILVQVLGAPAGDSRGSFFVPRSDPVPAPGRTTEVTVRTRRPRAPARPGCRSSFEQPRSMRATLSSVATVRTCSRSRSRRVVHAVADDDPRRPGRTASAWRWGPAAVGQWIEGDLRDQPSAEQIEAQAGVHARPGACCPARCCSFIGGRRCR